MLCVRFVAILSLLVLGLCSTLSSIAGEAKNVIILISDGGGFGIYNAASYYEHGRLGAQPYDQKAWSKYAMLTTSLSSPGSGSFDSDRKTNGFDPATVWAMDSAYALALAGGVPLKSYTLLKQSPTDSAAAGTAMASGMKTTNGAVNYVAEDMDRTLSPAKGRTIAELAKAMGKSTGVVTSVPLCDATPAAFGGAHAYGRSSWREISNEMFTSGTLDLIMGTGHPEYDSNGAPREPRKESDYDAVGGSFTWNLLVSGRHALGWRLVQSKAEFEALTSGPVGGRILGVPRVASSLQSQRQTRDWNKDGRVDDLDQGSDDPHRSQPEDHGCGRAQCVEPKSQRVLRDDRRRSSRQVRSRQSHRTND